MTLSDLWPGFQGHDIFWSWISQKGCILGTKLLKNTNRKPYQSIEWYHFQWPWVTSDPDFKVTLVFDTEYLRNDTRQSYSYHRTSIRCHMHPIELWHFQWSSRTNNQVFKVTAFWSRISQKQCVLRTKLLLHTNRKQYPTYLMVPCLVTLTDL